MDSRVATLHVDFNSGRKHLFDAIKVGDTLWADDGEGLRCRVTVTEVRMSEHSEDCVVIITEGDYDTLEDFEDGRWVPRNPKLVVENCTFTNVIPNGGQDDH